ncbi:PREDICTED: olfactory receptor 8D2-like [Chrysochloris asiatica]|uniref:Olfactory receptor n=1 Tax=Chrysochloris asiatica TaxID=185453 RepID=A0A9B0U2B7_CHRAS|nr:PREDICTED: olfactory receptor 8D2-like [Chrysochloris asiatica]
MITSNDSSVYEFILEGLTSHPELQLPLFLLFLGIYVVTVVANLGMIILIVISSQLHSPMYYFLSHLSFIDLCYSSVITPKMLVNFVSEKNIISFLECMAQLYFFLIFVIAEGYLLTAMAYDRYVAICSPLHYNTIMSHRVCSIMMAVVYSLGLFGATVHTTRMSMLSFCGSHIVSHYFCDILPLLALSCSSTHINEVLLFIIGGVNTLAPTLAVLISYAFIFYSILHIRSTEGRSKAFGTCSSHLTAVVVSALLEGQAPKLELIKCHIDPNRAYGKLKVNSCFTAKRNSDQLSPLTNDGYPEPRDCLKPINQRVITALL